MEQRHIFAVIITMTFLKSFLKGAVCRIELGIAVQIQNIGDGFFHPAPPPQT